MTGDEGWPRLQHQGGATSNGLQADGTRPRLTDASLGVHRAFIASAASALLLVGSAHVATSRAFIATVERISGGDTIVAIADDRAKFRLRLLHSDRPEIAHGTKPGRPFGEEARQYLDHQCHRSAP